MTEEYFSQSLEIFTNFRGGPSFLGERILQKVWIISSPLLCFNCKSGKDEISSSFIRFQYIVEDSEERLSDFWNFYKLKRGDLIFGENQFCRKSEWFGHPFCISILNVLKTQIRYSLDFRALCLIKE